MRPALFTALAALPLLTSGCSGQCGAGNQLNGQTFRVFANPVSWTNDNPAYTSGPDFYSYGAFANGVYTWSFKWGNADIGPVDVTVDGATFSAREGDWDPLECGHLIIDEMNGSYVDTAGVEHNFSADLSLTVFDGELGGLMVWAESWNAPDGESGAFRSTSHMQMASGGGGG